MTWVRIDDLFPDHPKVMSLSDRAFRLHISALCYCARALTDGHVPADFTRSYGRVRGKIIAELVAAHLWDITDNGYLIHDYTDYQPTREKVLAERENTAQRVQRWRHRKRAGNAVTNGGVTPLVTVPPSHPIPIPPYPRTAGEQDFDETPTPREAGTNPRAREQQQRAQRAHRSFVTRTRALYKQWLAAPDADPELVAHQIREAYPEIADEVLA